MLEVECRIRDGFSVLKGNIMSKVLYIKGNPKSTEHSFSLQLGEGFLSAYRAAHPSSSVETLDLYDDYIPLLDADVFSAWGKFRGGQAGELTAEEGRKIARMNELQTQFLDADRIILAAPIWNYGYPPMVKAYIDTAVVIAGKTFAYTDQGPVGLLKGKDIKVAVLESAGSFYSGTPMEGHMVWRHHIQGVLNYIGIQDISFTAAEGMAVDPESAPALLEKALSSARELAPTF